MSMPRPLQAHAHRVEPSRPSRFRPAGTQLVKKRGVHRARYDVVILIRTTSVPAATKLREHPTYQQLSGHARAAADHTLEAVAGNAVRLGDVDHRPNHVFLFNYFYADGKADLLPVFEYTAGWFQAKTDLPNSTLLQPLQDSDHGIINHASWPSFRTFPAQPDLPSVVPHVRDRHLRGQQHRRPTDPLPASAAGRRRRFAGWIEVTS